MGHKRPALTFGVTLLAAGLAMSSVAITSAWADSATSTVKYYGPFLGYTYYNDSTVYTNNSPDAGAATFVSDHVYQNVPAGYMEASARLYKSNGAACVVDAYSPNPLTSGPAWADSTNQADCGPGVYYAHGASAAYNGSGYNYYTTNPSPNLTQNS